ncbi:MAG: SGNH/GDSL hydrolase family protein [Planctomycetota bacterium]|nr:SGNH/GDSL hydrolase family protein [Planctomycetota bacterium]
MPPSASQPASQPADSHVRPRGGLANVRVRIERDKEARVAFLGGSITASAGWRDLVCASLKKRFPETKFDFINAGIPSLGSTPDAFRFERDVWKHGSVDLLFIDAAVNDESNGFTPVEQVRGMEGIVRRARLMNPAIDVVVLHFVTPHMVEEYNAGKKPVVIASHESVAAHYVVPSIDMAQETARGVAAKEWTQAQFGGVHPHPFGHQLYGRGIDALFDREWAGALAGDAKARPHTLPPPLDEASYFAGKLVPVDAAKPGEGWTLDPHWKPTDKLETRGGFVNVPVLIAERPGATMTLAFEGRTVGIFVASGADAGTVEYSVDGGPWRSRELFTGWSRSLHLPWAVILDGDLKPGKHVLSLRPSEKHHAKSDGHAVRIVHFLVN